MLVNTCSVRQHAEDRVWSKLGKLRIRKRTHPELVVGVLGCMAQEHKRYLLSRMPHVDLVVGPSAFGDIDGTVDDARPMLAPVLRQRGLLANRVPTLLRCDHAAGVQFEAVSLVGFLLAHKKVALEFVDGGGVALLLRLCEGRHAVQLSSPLALAFYGLATMSSSFEKILLQSPPRVGRALEPGVR